MPNGEPTWAMREQLLSFEEIAFVSEIFVSMGIEKIRLTGGEPLIRRDVPKLVKQLSVLKPQLRDLALTTNGSEFPRHAEALRTFGLDRVTISLDSLRPKRFAEITGVDALGRAFEAIEMAQKCGFNPVKINTVVVRGRNDDEIADFARFARENAVSVRFIEYMPLDSGREWSRASVVSGREIRERIEAAYPLRLKNASRGSETAWKYEFADGAPGEIGIIAPVTEMFCGQCSRIRLTADGQIRTCLFSTTEYDLRGVIRSGAPRAEIESFIEAAVLKKEPRHHINDPEFVQPARTMSFIGG